MPIHILIADEDREFAEAVAWCLEARGLRVTVVGESEQASALLQSDPPQAMVLSQSLPGAGDVPAQDLPTLLIGADGQPRPGGAMELVAPVETLLRRAGLTHKTRRPPPELRLDEERREVLCDGRVLALPPLEFALLKALLGQPEVPQSRDRLAETIWGENHYGDLRLVDKHIANLRASLLEAGLRPVPIATVRGVGYVYRVE